MNTQLVESLVQAIRALFTEECAALEQRLFFKATEPATGKLAMLVMDSSATISLLTNPTSTTLMMGSLPVSIARGELIL
ncbi:MAG: hypothetical protein AAFN12_00455 [Cyanobacteria bacterium J06560_2]